MAVEGERRTASCPSCGAPLRFRGATSIVAVCAFCKSTLVRDGARLEDIGKQAELLEDLSPLRIGASGRHKGAPFQVVGRIQYRYGAGVWNEWHVVFDDGKSAWLSDASREYTIAYLAPPTAVPPFAELKPGAALSFAGEPFTVTNIESAEVVAGEGELPFRFQAGWKANVADLRGAGARFATIDYSEDIPHVYLGERLPFDTFGFGGLRDPEQVGFATGKALAYKCAGCGAPIEKHLTTTEVVACGSCGTVTDVTDAIGKLVQKNQLHAGQFPLTIPLGTRGTWKGVQYEVVGFMRRGITVDGQLYAWGEYLLHDIERGYAWISEYQGHYSFIHAAAELPRAPKGGAFSIGKPTFNYLGHKFTHFQKATAEVTYVIGEFYWRVKVGDKALCEDYVCPPLILSAETTDNEVSWSLGEYLPREALAKAFALKGALPMARGVAPNQPSPHKGKVGRYWLAAFAFLLAGLGLQVVLAGLGSAGRPVALQVNFPAGQAGRAVTPVFELTGRLAGPVILKTQTSVHNTWLHADYQLVDADSGRAFAVKRELGFKDIGGARDGSSDDFAEIRGVPKGRYTLAVDARSGPIPNEVEPVNVRVDVYREGLGWSNFFLFALFVILWPIVAWAQAHSFEKERWSESDYAPDD